MNSIIRLLMRKIINMQKISNKHQEKVDMEREELLVVLEIHIMVVNINKVLLRDMLLILNINHSILIVKYILKILLINRVLLIKYKDKLIILRDRPLLMLTNHIKESINRVELKSDMDKTKILEFKVNINKLFKLIVRSIIHRLTYQIRNFLIFLKPLVLIGRK